jgi:hypothetical protein
MENDHLYVLWTNADILTSEKMVFMYAINSLRKGWWKKVTLIVWGATTKLVSENELVQLKIKQAIDEGIYITACKACADQLGVTEKLEELGIEVKYWGEPLTEIIKNKAYLLTV